MKVVESAWKDYAGKVLPWSIGSDSVQYKETRKAFYAGAGCLIDSLMKVLGPGLEPTESDLLIMGGIAAELEQFAKDVQASKD